MAQTPKPTFTQTSTEIAEAHVGEIMPLLGVEFPGEEISYSIKTAEASETARPRASAFIEIKIGGNETNIRVDVLYDVRGYGASQTFTTVGYAMYPAGVRSARAVLKKDNTFAYDRIAAVLGEEVRSRRRRALKANVSQTNRIENASYIEAFNRAAQPDLGHIMPNDQPDGPPLIASIQFKVRVSGPAAAELAEYLRSWHQRHVKE